MNEQVADKQRISTTMILADSTTSRINIGNIKDNINTKEEAVIFKQFPGHTADEIAFYAPKPLSDCKPERVIIVAGTNSLTKSMYEKNCVDEYEVVESILKIGRAARGHGAGKICISGLLVRRGYPYQEAVRRVNDLLYMACVAEHFVYLDQSGITLDHISSDGIHPNHYGSTILKYNILSVFDSFDRDLMDFRDDYEWAISAC